MEYWKKIDQKGNTTTVESHSFYHKVPDAIKITEEEYDNFISSLPETKPKPPPRDLATEIDDLKVELKTKGIIDL